MKNGGLAQLARAPALHAGGHRFDSDILHTGGHHAFGRGILHTGGHHAFGRGILHYFN